MNRPTKEFKEELPDINNKIRSGIDKSKFVSIDLYFQNGSTIDF